MLSKITCIYKYGMYPSDPYADCFCLATRRLARLLTQAYDRKLAPTGLKVTQFSVLVAVDKAGERGGRLAPLAKALDMDASTLTRVLMPLVRDNLVALDEGEDRRERRARLTQAGRNLLAEAIPLWTQAQAETLERLGAAGLQHVKAILAAMRGS